ncbi:MAG: cadmium-translocating P-type ATPase [Candidatus Obscuribacterales bacterium]|nr:cadmium-translocating P-type ATPase [Candidatus Obscuribacterales bacterium]
MDQGCHMPSCHEEQKQTGSYRPSVFDTLRILVTALLIGLLWVNLVPLIAGVQLCGLIAALVLGFPIYREAFSAILARRMTMGLSMTIAIVAAVALGEAFTTLVIIFFVLIAEELEKFTIFRGKHSIRTLLDLLPLTAFVRRDGGELKEVPLAEVLVGDVVLIKPGGRVVVDGVVVAGRSFVDESTITGEALPIEKQRGARVFAGSVNHGGAIEVCVESVGKETVFGKVIAAVKEAESNRGNVQRLADRLSAWLVYFSLAMAAVTWFVTGDAHQTISVVIVSGACGIAAGTPLAIYGAIGRAARMGVIIKGGAYVEQLAEVNTVVFDKTGTLTYGAPRVVSIRPAPGVAERDLVRIAAAAESLSEHPIARAVRACAADHSVEKTRASDLDVLPGLGIRCLFDGKKVLAGNRKLLLTSGVEVPAGEETAALSEVFVAYDGLYLGSMHVADKVRKEAYQALRDLRELGVCTLLYSGDNEAAVRRVAEQLDFKDYCFGMTPEDKFNRVRELKRPGLKVAMVGDGVNDAPALTEAHVGIAMGSGADVALESADVMLIGNNLNKLVDTIRVARQCRRIILMNFVGTITVDALGMGLAFFGLLSPILAALVHSGSEVVFLLNSVRLLPFFQRTARRKMKTDKRDE